MLTVISQGLTASLETVLVLLEDSIQAYAVSIAKLGEAVPRTESCTDMQDDDKIVI